jgi:hypothetical protein
MRRILVMSAVLMLGAPVLAWAGFPGTDVYLASVGAGPGAQSSEWYTTAWISNPGSEEAQVQIYFLDRGHSNPAPDVFSTQIGPGETHRIENIVEDLFGDWNRFGAIRVVSDRSLIVNSRIFSVPSGGDEEDSTGQFFGAAPASFSIEAGESTEILGVYQNTPVEDSPFRYNFGFVETSGGNASVRVRVYSELGFEVGAKDYPIGPRGMVQYNISDVLPAIDDDNYRLRVEVISGTGRILAFGSGIANESNDPSTFEMSFSEGLLGGGGGLDSVTHDGTLVGNGTPSSPLGLADDAVTAAKLATTNTGADGDSLTYTPGGLQWRAISGGGGGGLTLPYSGTGLMDETLFTVSNTSTYHLAGAIQGQVEYGYGVRGTAVNSDPDWGSYGVVGANLEAMAVGALGADFAGSRPIGVIGDVINAGSGSIGVWGNAVEGVGVEGSSEQSAGVRGTSDTGDGVSGQSGGSNKSGVYGSSTASNGYGVYGRNTTNSNVGYLGGPGAGAWGRGEGGSHGVYGEAVGGGNAGQFLGDVHITGNLSKGGGTFIIDHPLDPEHRTLSHSFVESPDMMNVYNGVAILGGGGEAWVELPAYFEALNRDFRYQLTCVGGYAPVYIAEEIAGNRFKIGGGSAGLKVSWEVTGIRQDPWAEANRVLVEADKAPEMMGTLIHSEAFAASGN